MLAMDYCCHEFPTTNCTNLPASNSSYPATNPAFGNSGAEHADLHLLKNKRVVIAEDEGIIQLLIRKALASAGLQVVGAAMEGEGALQVVMQERPDIILLDVKMAGTMNGLDVARKVLTVYNPCIAILSAYAEFEEEAIEIGASGYIMKPVDSIRLLSELRSIYRRYSITNIH